MQESNDLEKQHQPEHPTSSPPESQEEHQMPIQQRRTDEESNSITLIRTPNFFVRGFRPQPGTDGTQKTDGSDTIMERIRWTSVEKQRLMAAQTRMLPTVVPLSAPKREIATPIGLEVLTIVLVLGITLSIQAFNLFYYPTYTIDEGSYMANAWAVLHGRIEPYTYIYDHPPLGWFQIAAWLQLTGGVASFGNAINSGRVLMLILTIASSLLLYLITNRLSGSSSAALLAMAIYSLSPLSMIYRREVLLDTIGTFWLLLSLYLITTGKSKLHAFVLAAIALGIAILTKETFILFLPALLYGVWLYATPFQLKFSVISFIYITLTIASVYVLLAALKGELFPPGVLPGDRGPHPSLIGTLIEQWQAPPVSGQFLASWNTWMQADKLFFMGGSIAMFINIVGGTVNRFQLLAALLAITFWVFLLFSNVVYSYSIVPLLPFLALNITLALNTPLQWLTRRIGFDLVRMLLCFALVAALSITDIQRTGPLLTKNNTEPQQQAMLWIRNNVPRTAVIITNTYMYTDLHEPGGMGVGSTTPFSHAHIYSNAALDPEVSNKELKGDWQKINFLIVDTPMLKEIRASEQYELLNQALHHATLRVAFGSSRDGTQIQVYQVIHT